MAATGTQSLAQASTQADDRRRWERYAMSERISATLVADGQPYECTVEDISLGGVKLRLAGEAPAAKNFELRHPAAGSFPALRVWRQDTILGVRFDIAEETRAHVLQCISLVLNPDAGAALPA